MGKREKGKLEWQAWGKGQTLMIGMRKGGK